MWGLEASGTQLHRNIVAHGSVDSEEIPHARHAAARQPRVPGNALWNRVNPTHELEPGGRMSLTRSLARGALALAGLMLMAAPPPVGGQVPTKKPVPRDSTVKSKTPVATSSATTRIKIGKEQTAGGEVVPLPVARDTIVTTVYVTDPAHDAIIRAEQHRLDSIAESLVRARLRNEMARRVRDTEMRVRGEFLAAKDAEALALTRSLARGMYFGIAGGASAPQRSLRNGYTGGYNLTVPIGYDATNLPWGIRIDASLDHMNGTRVYNQLNETLAASGDITVWSLNSDLKLRIPLPKVSTRTHFYTLGGIGMHKVTGGVYGTTDPSSGSNVPFDNAHVRFGWNVGAGAAIAWGPAEVFIESRFMQVKSDLPYHMSGGVGTYTSFTPVLIGVQWF